MAKTSKKPKPSAIQPKPEANGVVMPEVLTLGEAAEFLRLAQPVVQRLALGGRLPGRVAEGEWRFLRDALREWLSGTDFAKPSEPVSPLSPKERFLAIAGCLSDDDSLPVLVEEIYRERKRNAAGGSA
jgi:hypothetical protein